jgi:hypothetical protein
LAFACLNYPQKNYELGDYLSQPGCEWTRFDQNYDLIFQGATTEGSAIQNYDFKGHDNNGLSNASWNLNGESSYSIYNRSLGNPILNSSLPLTKKYQSSHVNLATKLNNDSHLLGLQSFNSINNLDTNTNRPQLNAQFRQEGDNYGGTIAENMIDDDSILGVRARTGQPSLRSSVPLNKRFLVILSKTI